MAHTGIIPDCISDPKQLIIRIENISVQVLKNLGIKLIQPNIE